MNTKEIEVGLRYRVSGDLANGHYADAVSYTHLYSDAHLVLWASLECTNFSKAKGGQPRDADSRTLAEHLFRYIETINPDYIQIENVEEFMSWGDMDENGKPISMDKGRLYQRWVRNVRKYGYNFDFRILNAADYGAYTTRKDVYKRQNEAIEEYKNKVIDEQLDAIRQIAPDIVIIEV